MASTCAVPVLFDVISAVNCVSLSRRRRFNFIGLYPNSDVISEVNCVLLSRRWRFKIIALYPNSDVISEGNYVSFLLSRRRRFKFIALYSNSDVISEVNYVLLSRRWRFKIIALYPNSDVISVSKAGGGGFESHLFRYSFSSKVEKKTTLYLNFGRYTQNNGYF